MLFSNSKRLVKYEEDRMWHFWRDNKIANKCFNLYRLLSIIIASLLIIDMCILLFSPYMIEYAVNGNGAIPFSTLQILLDKKLRIKIYGAAFDHYNLFVCIGEFLFILVGLLLLVIMLVKCIVGDGLNYRKKWYIKIFNNIKTPIVNRKSTRITFSICLIFVFIFYGGLLNFFVENGGKGIVYIVLAGIIDIICCVLLAARRRQQKLLEKEILKYEFYKRENNAMQKM